MPLKVRVEIDDCIEACHGHHVFYHVCRCVSGLQRKRIEHDIKGNEHGDGVVHDGTHAAQFTFQAHQREARETLLCFCFVQQLIGVLEGLDSQHVSGGGE